MIRRIVKIDEAKCNGCGACAKACHESAIGMVNGKAKLLRDDYCDGLGDCLPACPTGAISFEEREAEAYDEKAVKENMARKAAEKVNAHHAGCPGSAARTIQHRGCPGSAAKVVERKNEGKSKENASCVQSELRQWPVQIKLLPVQAPFYEGANLLIAADCAAYAYGNFHRDFMRNKITAIGCPKLDSGDYSEKLTEIIRLNDIKSVTIVRMQVPCCGGLEQAAKKALQNSGKFIPWQVVTINHEGKILD